jgi:transposase
MGFIPYNRSQMNLLGYSIEDFARNDPKSRFVVELVSRLDLSALYSRYSSQGGDSYAPDMMLALWFYAYSNGITSTRKLEELCKFDTRYMYITSNQQPDHSTLSRFRKAHLDLLSEYFLEILLIAQAEGISDFSQISIDGTKINAKSSARHSYREDQLERKIEAIRADIRHYMQRCDFVEQGASDELDLESLRSEKERLERLEQELLERKAQLQTRKKELKPEHRSKHQINVKEPEARMMPSLDAPGYNAQLGVDMSTHLIVAQDVVSKANDQGQFIPIQQQVEANLGADNNRSYTADSGYHNSSDLKELEEKQVDAVIADPQFSNRSIQEAPTSMDILLKENRKLKRSDFVYHEEENYYECPAGKKLFPIERKGDKIIYRSTDCQGCPLINLCVSSKKKVKQIHRSFREGYSERMARKLQTPEAQERLRKRSLTVEPVFGNLKQNLGYRRFSLSGLKNVRGEFTLMCIGHNINILFKKMLEKRFAAFITVSQEKYEQYIALSKNFWAFLVLFFAQHFKTKRSNLCLNI